MRSVRLLMFGVLVLGACQDDPMTSDTPGEPAPPVEGIQAFIQVSDDRAQPGDQVRVWVKAQIGGETEARLGSYTGRLHFDAEALRFLGEAEIDDGMRVTNPAGAPEGELRFAGASPTGLTNLVLYEATFEVTKTDYLAALELLMEEVTAAISLADLTPALQIAPRIFLRAE